MPDARDTGLSPLAGTAMTADTPSMPPRLTVLTRDECLALLPTVPIGRVGLTLSALPVVLPVNFAVLDGDIVFRTVEGTKFHAAATGTVVAFEVDDHDRDGAWGWSVMVQGPSRVLTEAAEVSQVRRLVVDPWAVDGRADRTVRITNALMSGRRFERRP
jgi:nitroimidazol reductase NimA-like FMN-containing flavoprotein (pyridoxamine 5'-phosphate oxidase superfamily)